LISGWKIVCHAGSHEKEVTISVLWLIALRRLLAIRSIRKAIYCGMAVGTIVGLIVALVVGHWAVILVGWGIGTVLGVSLGLIIRGVGIMRRGDEGVESEHSSEEERK
jgi:putative Ca2+/H+ antiporter (TMEM165/GDT1 family)